MNRTEKRRFIRELTASVRDAVLEVVPRMPDEWKGIELRHVIAKKFAESSIADGRTRRSVENEMLNRGI